jgi:hypothetical protein
MLDRRMIDLHNRMFAIGFGGNLILDTVGLTAGQIQAGNIPHLMGKGIPTEYLITNGPGASANIANVAFQLSDAAGNPVAAPLLFDVWLSDAASGAGLTATTASGGIAAVTSDGIVWSVQTASKAVRVQANASGLFTLAITDTAKTAFYPVAQNPMSGLITVGAQLTTASYHA